MDRDRHQGDIEKTLLSLQELAAFESKTIAAETNAFGILRDRMSSVARFGGTIPVKYQRVHYKTNNEGQHTEYLPDGFPLDEGPRPLSALLVVDRFSVVDPGRPAARHALPEGRYAGECLYLSWDKKWILTERVGAYSEAKDSSSEWVAHCKALTDRSLLERYSLETVTAGLFAATNKVWEKLSPRMDAIRQRSEKVQHIVNTFTRFESPLPDTVPADRAVLAPANRFGTLSRAER